MIILHSKDRVKNQQKTREGVDEYRAEVAAFANQRLLGNKAFVKKLITTDPSTAEKLIAKIREIRENLMIRNPSAKAQLELVRKAEKLFMQGLSEAGGTIDNNGKIHLANDEEDEGDTLTRENSEKTHVSEENGVENAAEAVDEKARVRYNRRTTVDEKAGTDYLIHNFSGEVKYDPEILPLSDQELAIISYAVKTGWGKLNVDKKCGYVFSANNFYWFVYNADNSITVIKQLDADIEQKAIDIARRAIEGDEKGRRTPGTFSTWATSVRNGGAGYRYHSNGSVGKSETSGNASRLSGDARGSHDSGDLGRSGGDRANGQVKFNRDGSKAKLTVNGETLKSIGKPSYFTDVAQNRRAVWRFGADRFYVQDAQPGERVFYETAEAAVEAENENLIRAYAKRHGQDVDFVKRRIDEDYEYLTKETDKVVRRSRTTTGEVVTLSKGEMAKLHANYAGDKVFAKGAVTEALKGIDALKALSAERRREIANEIWTGYNKRLHQQGEYTNWGLSVCSHKQCRAGACSRRIRDCYEATH